jgi:alpha-maltose-1-phosphate synthase
MAAPGSSLRVVGVSRACVSDWREPLPAGKWSQFFAALADHWTITDIVTPEIPKLQEYVNLARWLRPNRASWLGCAGFNQGQLRRVDAVVERELAHRAGTYDLIVQLQTICTPRSASVRAPYLIYTDNTMALTQRLYRPYAQIPPRMLREWLAFEAQVCLAAEKVFTFSEFARSSVIDDYGCAPEHVVAVGAGANQYVDSLTGKDYSRPRALFVGSPFDLKGGQTLLAAWKIVHAAVPEAELVIAGPKQDPAPGIASRVQWIGRVSRNELARQYGAASVFVLPSLFDAWGHVFIEAMGYGLPCIGSDCCAMPEIIEHGVSGLVVPRAQPEALAQALIEVLTDPQRAAGMGRAGHARVLRLMTWPRVADRVTSQIAPVLAGCAGTAR